MAKKLNRIKVVLVEKDISQTDIGRSLRQEYSTINAYCANRQQPSLEVLSQNRISLVGIKDLIID